MHTVTRGFELESRFADLCLPDVVIKHASDYMDHVVKIDFMVQIKNKEFAVQLTLNDLDYKLKDKWLHMLGCAHRAGIKPNMIVISPTMPQLMWREALRLALAVLAFQNANFVYVFQNDLGELKFKTRIAGA